MGSHPSLIQPPGWPLLCSSNTHLVSTYYVWGQAGLWGLMGDHQSGTGGQTDVKGRSESREMGTPRQVSRGAGEDGWGRVQE